MRDNGDVGGEREGGNSAPYAGKIKENSTEYHCSRGTTRDDTTRYVDAAYCLPRSRIFKRLKQVARFATGEVDEVGGSKFCGDGVVIRISLCEEFDRFNYRTESSEMVNAHLYPTFGNDWTVGYRRCGQNDDVWGA